MRQAAFVVLLLDQVTMPPEDIITNNSSALAEKLNDSSIDRVMAIDAHWNIIAWNKTSELHSGFSRNELLGKNLLEVFPVIREDEEMMSAITRAFDGYKSFLPSAPGLFNRHHTENHFIPLREDRGAIIGVMNIMHDVAHRVKVEKQLIKLNTALEKKYIQLEKANNDLATFTYVAGHEIKEPIRNVYTSLEFLARKEGNLLSNASRGGIRKIQASLNRMNLLLDDILNISRIGKKDKEFEFINLNVIIEDVKKRIVEKLDSDLTVNATELPTIKGSVEMLTYLFQHLIDNAIKFQPEGNTPAITISCQEVASEDLPGNPEVYYEISVTDNGIGFEQTQAETIFDMFTRLHEKGFRGSGIGLTICKRIMDIHEGMITATSSPGAGSTFKCFFPTNESQ